jgi:hypothetical protein
MMDLLVFVIMGLVGGFVALVAWFEYAGRARESTTTASPR